MIFFSLVCECTAKAISTERGGSFFLKWRQFMPVLFFFTGFNRTSWESFNATLAVVPEILRSFEPSKMRHNSRSNCSSHNSLYQTQKQFDNIRKWI